MILDNAIYVDGRRAAEPRSLQETGKTCREPDRFAPTQFASAAGKLGLDELAVEDAIRPHQRPNLERYDDSLFVVLKSARYVDGRIEFGEIHAFLEPNFIVTVLFDEEPALDVSARRWRASPTGSGRARSRSSTGSCTRSSRVTSRWSKGSRTTSTR